MRFRIFGVERALNSRLKRVEEIIKDPELLDRIGRLSVSHVQKRTRDGLDVNNQPFKALADSTIKRRQALSKTNRTSAYYLDVFSNLHFTGQLVRALRFVVQNSRVYLKLDPTRKPYQTQSGQAQSSATNTQIQKYQKDLGRDFLGADETLREKIRETVARAIRRLIRRTR